MKKKPKDEISFFFRKEAAKVTQRRPSVGSLELQLIAENRVLCLSNWQLSASSSGAVSGERGNTNGASYFRFLNGLPSDPPAVLSA